MPTANPVQPNPRESQVQRQLNILQIMQDIWPQEHIPRVAQTSEGLTL